MHSSGVVVQRKTGLAAVSQTTSFAQNAYNFWKDEANETKPLKEFSDYLVAQAISALPDPKFPCTHAYGGSGNRGQFDPSKWVIDIDTSRFSRNPSVSQVSELVQSEVGEVVDAIYHEVRHSEQYFRIARLKAGDNKTAKQIANQVGVPMNVAEAAVASPLGKAEGAEQKVAEEVKEAEDWEQITVGKHQKYKEAIQSARAPTEAIVNILDSTTDDADTKINKVGPILGHLEAAAGALRMHSIAVEKITKKDKFDEAVVEHLKKVQAAFDALNAEFTRQEPKTARRDIPTLRGLAFTLYQMDRDAYLDFEHEKDAWAVGGAARTAFNELAEERKRQAVQAKQPAEAEQEPESEPEPEPEPEPKLESDAGEETEQAQTEEEPELDLGALAASAVGIDFQSQELAPRQTEGHSDDEHQELQDDQQHQEQDDTD
jgi:hypothetical protein